MIPKLYTSLTDWWPLLSPASDYREEAEIYQKYLEANCHPGQPLTLLELGSGGGNNASFLKQRFETTLVDASRGMLAQSHLLNPECEHVQGDMRTVRLGRTFDRVFIHDAICYMTTPDDLRRAIETAFVHCGPESVAVFAPDWVRETFSPGTDHGGSDGSQRGLRYLEWTWDPDPSDSEYFADYIYALRDENGLIQIEHDRHIEGIFGREEWLRILHEVGFQASVETFSHSEVDHPLELFVAVRPKE